MPITRQERDLSLGGGNTQKLGSKAVVQSCRRAWRKSGNGLASAAASLLLSSRPRIKAHKGRKQIIETPPHTLYRAFPLLGKPLKPKRESFACIQAHIYYNGLLFSSTFLCEIARQSSIFGFLWEHEIDTEFVQLPQKRKILGNFLLALF